MWSEVDSVLQQGRAGAAGSFLGTFLSSPGSVTDKFPELGTLGWDPADAHTASPKSPGLGYAKERRTQTPAGIGDLKASDILRAVTVTARGKDSAPSELGMFRIRSWISRAGAIK